MIESATRPAEPIYSVRHLAYGLFLIFTFLAAYLLSASGIIDAWIAYGGWTFIIMAFIGGLFFTSFATIALSVVMIAALARAGMPIYLLALFGGFGAMFGDAGILKTLQWSVLDDVGAYIARKTQGAFGAAVQQRSVRILSLILGAIVIASPLPDEVGMAVMGIAHLPTRQIMLVSFLLNAAGISALALVTR